MTNNTSSPVQRPAQGEVKRRGKFLDAILPANVVQATRAMYHKKPFIEFVIPDLRGGIITLLCTNGYVAQFADFLGIPVKLLYGQLKQRVIAPGFVNSSENPDWINQALQSQGDRLIKFSAHQSDKGDWWIHTVATHIHQTVTYRQQRAIVKEMIRCEIEETKHKRGYTWEYQSAEFACKGEQFNVRVRIYSGDNTKDSAMQVRTVFRVGSCNNTAIAAEQIPIKRTTGWEGRFREAIENAKQIAETIEEVIRVGMEEPITLEEGMAFIDKLPLGIRKQEKIEHIKDALKQRFEKEFKEHNTKWALSQALSYVGTHDDPRESTERTLEDLQALAMQVLH